MSLSPFNASQVKCVELLLAGGAEPNALNSDSHTPLHFAVQRYIHSALDTPEDDEDFEAAKRVAKELLFNGADRSAVGRFNLHSIDPTKRQDIIELTPLDLLLEFENDLPP